MKKKMAKEQDETVSQEMISYELWCMNIQLKGCIPIADFE